MRTRLRTHQRTEDEPTRTTPAADPPLHTALPEHRLVQLQRMLGNAATRRYLQRGAPSTAINREPPKDAPAKTVAPGKPKALVFLTMSTLEGKQIRGKSKHKGREGQIELLHFSQHGLSSGHGGRLSHDGAEAPKRERIAGANVTTSKEMSEFSLSKLLDDASPDLAEVAISGKPVRIRVDFVNVNEQGQESLGLSFELPEAMLTHHSLAQVGPDQIESMSLQSKGMSITIPDVVTK